MKKISLLLLCLVTVIFATSTPQPTAAAPDITVFLDGRLLTFDVQPQIINDRTVVPLRVIFEAMGATVNWGGDNQTVTATKGNTVVKLTIGNSYPTINGQTTIIDQPAIIVSGRTLAPLRFVAEAFGGSVNWEATTRTINIYESKDGITAPPVGQTIDSLDSVYRELSSLGSKLNLSKIEETRWGFRVFGSTVEGELDKDIATKCGVLRVIKKSGSSAASSNRGTDSNLVFSINGAELAFLLSSDEEEDDGVDLYVLDLCKDDPYMYVFAYYNASDVDGHATIFRYDGSDWGRYMEFNMSTKLAYSDGNGKVYFVNYDNKELTVSYSICTADVTNRTIQKFKIPINQATGPSDEPSISYNGISAKSLLARSKEDVIALLGQPDQRNMLDDVHIYGEMDLEITYSETHKAIFLSISASKCKISGTTLDKTRAELIKVLGEPVKRETAT